MTAPTTKSSTSGILFGLMVPAMTVGLYIAMFGVALPTIRADFGIPADLTAWVATIYTLPFMIFMPLYGRLGDTLGKQRLLIFGLIVFLAGSAIAGAAPNLTWLMLGRGIQGFGTAGFVPLSLAIIVQRFPAAKRGQAMGTWNSAIPMMGILGPYLGGLLVDTLGWRAVFGPVLVVGLGAIFVVQRNVPGSGGKITRNYVAGFDWGGVVLLGTTLTGFLFFTASRPVTGVASLRDWRLLAVTLFLLAAFVVWELKRPDPLVSLGIFRHRTFSLTSIIAGIRMFAMSGINFLVPLYLDDIYGLSAATIGLVVMVHATALFLILRFGGQLADRLGSRWPVMFSLTVQAGAMAYLALLPAETGLGLIVFGVLLHGLGAAISLAALHRASTVGIPAEQAGVAAGLYSMIRFAGTVFGTALTGVILQQGLDRGLSVLDAYQGVYWVIAAVALVGATLGATLRE